VTTVETWQNIEVIDRQEMRRQNGT
jgi:hypothetical protein